MAYPGDYKSLEDALTRERALTEKLVEALDQMLAEHQQAYRGADIEALTVGTRLACDAIAAVRASRPSV